MVILQSLSILDKVLHELSSCEWKRYEAADATLFKQQGKNLRTNASILSKLVKMGCFSSTIAMDWSGAEGHAYTMSFENNVFIARPLQALVLPKRASQLESFKDITARILPQI
ncbi:hypothetical protein INT45_014071 [Circinella minor]|uniref:Uncharacterized protein n=1 Tax=Circinella minor TaxID=1195481 RepID=A0A8H7VF14_9FUNG|nr:hypothetical protein INT45_014071 [Circinella minor]